MMHASISSNGAACSLHGAHRRAGSRRVSARAVPRDGATRPRREAPVYTPAAPVTDAAVPEGHVGLHGLLYGEGGAERHETDSHYEFRQGEDDGSTLLPVPAYLESRDGERGVVGVYAIHDSKGNLQYVGYARNIVLAVKGHLSRVGEERCALVRPMVFANKAMASRTNLERQAQVWLDAAGTLPPGNGVEADLWSSGRAWSTADLSPAERALHDEQKLKMKKAMGENLADGIENEDEDLKTRRLKRMAAVEGDDWSAVIDGQTAATLPPQQQQQAQQQTRQQEQQAQQQHTVVSPFSRANVHRSIGNSSAQASSSGSSNGAGTAEAAAPAPPDMTPEAVDKALDEVRPYLMADGGNVEVAGVESGNVLLRLQGACGTCPSSSATMKMGIERALRAAFGDQLKEVMQVDAIDTSASIAPVDAHLNMLRPAIHNLGGKVEVMAVEGGVATVRYKGPKPLASGISAAIRDKFPDVKRVDLLDF